jgi:rod shape-determining protein MreC
VNNRIGSVGVAATTRSWSQRFGFVLVVILAFSMMLIGKPDSIVVSRARSVVTDLVAPVLGAVSRPIDAARETAGSVQDYLALQSENKSLRLRNESLVEWQRVARELQAQNAILKEMLNFTSAPNVRFVTAPVVADSSSSFVRSLIVLSGRRDGVAKGQAAITGVGLVGRVLEVGERSARILLLTDINARVPVVNERSRDQAMLAGTNSDLPELRHLSRDADLKVGDRIVTSGQGGVFPPGLPVGEILRFENDRPLVKPFVDLSRLEYLRLVDYGLPGILAEDLGVDALQSLRPNREDSAKKDAE